MTSAERLVNHIREFIHGFEQEATSEAHEMAMQFADLCHSLNDRLAKCADFLRKGMRSEAVQAALTQPSVFELAETLEFEESKNWLNLCLDLGMPPAPEIDLETIETLKTECTKEQLLEPLLREFRRLVHTGTRNERIRILRRIRSHDKDNPVWRENLEPLEQEQLVESRRRAGQAMAADDLEAVLDIYTDMTAAHRVVEAPPDAVAEIENWLCHRREAGAKEEGGRLAEALDEALEARRFEDLGPLLQAWRRLLKFPDFKASAAILDIAAKAESWYEEEGRGRRRRREFQENLHALQILLQSGRPEHREIEAKWNALLAYDFDLPEGLDASVTATLQGLRADDLRRRRNRSLAAVLATVALAAAAIFGGLYGYRSYRIAETRRELAGLWNANRHGDLRRQLDRVAETPWLYEGAKADLYAGQVDQALAAEATRLERLKQVMDGLARVKTDSYAHGGETIVALLAEARSFAERDEEKALIDGWERTWRSWSRDRQAQIDGEAGVKLDDLAADLDRSQANRQAPIERKLAELKRLEQRVATVGGEIAEATAPVRERLGQIRRDLAQWANDIEEERARREAERRRRAENLAAIPQTAGDIDGWRVRIEAFIKAFPDARESDDLRRALAQLPLALDAVALAGFQLASFPDDTESVRRIDALIATLPAGENSVWHGALSAARVQYAGHARMREELERLRMVDFYDLRQIRIRRKGEADWRTLFMPTYFHSQEVEDSPGVMLYWGRFLGLNPETTVATPEHFSFTTGNYDIDLAGDDEARLIPAARYIRQFLARLPAENLLLHLISEVDALKNRDDIPLVPRAVIMRIVGQAIVRGAAFPGIGFEAYGRAFDGINLSVPWYNHANPAILATGEEIATRIAALPEAADSTLALAFNRELLKASLNRRVRCVGLVWRPQETDTLQPVLAQAGVKSLWVVASPRPGVANQFREIAVADAQGAFALPTAGAERVLQGQLLFAPADGKTVAEIIAGLPPFRDRAKVQWPSPWPINARDL